MGRFQRFGISLLSAATALSAPATAHAVSFDSLTHGEIVRSLDGITITAESFNPNLDVDYAIGFDTRATGTRDRDLEASGTASLWSGGNIADEALNLILIIQENGFGCGDGFCDRPDDEGRRAAGNLTFDFATPLLDFGFDVVDVESATAENGMVFFFADGDDTADARVEFMDFVTAGSGFYDPSISYGDNTANRISPITAEALGIASFQRVTITMGGSGGVDNLAFTSVPEPTTVVLMAMGLLVAIARPSLRNAKKL